MSSENKMPMTKLPFGWILGPFLKKYCIYLFAIGADFSPSNSSSHQEITLIAPFLVWHLN
jgi:hypothetical protein